MIFFIDYDRHYFKNARQSATGHHEQHSSDYFFIALANPLMVSSLLPPGAL